MRNPDCTHTPRLGIPGASEMIVGWSSFKPSSVACEVHALKKWQRNELEVGEKISRPHGMRTYMPNNDMGVIWGYSGHLRKWNSCPLDLFSAFRGLGRQKHFLNPIVQVLLTSCEFHFSFLLCLPIGEVWLSLSTGYVQSDGMIFSFLVLAVIMCEGFPPKHIGTMRGAYLHTTGNYSSPDGFEIIIQIPRKIFWFAVLIPALQSIGSRMHSQFSCNWIQILKLGFEPGWSIEKIHRLWLFWLIKILKK